MKIEEVHVHNFRGLIDQRIHLYDYTLLVGPNNSGKTMVIDALRAFYEKDKFVFRNERDFPFVGASDEESWIDIHFSLSDEEFDSLADDYKGEHNKLRVRKYFKAPKPRNGGIFAYTSDGELSDSQFYGERNVQQGKFGDVVYIPAVSKIDEHTKLSGPSALRDLLTTVLTDVVASNKSFEKLSGDFCDFAEAIKTEESSDGRSLAALEADLSGLLAEWGAEFRVEMRPPSISEIIKSLLTYECLDKAHGKAVPAEQFGSGFQRHFIYSLVQIGTHYVRRKQTKKTKDFSPDLSLILFEEPEAFLHPPQQDVLAHGLHRLADDDARQVLCSTHSPHFVSRNMQHIPSIVRLRRTDGIVHRYQIDDNDWGNIVDSNQALNAIAVKWPELKKKLSENDLRPEMETVKYCLWLNPDRCGMFFANNVLLVEGPTEQAFLTRLLREGVLAAPESGVYVLDCIGKFNIHRYMNLLSQMGIPHAVVHDDDREMKYHPDIHKLIEDSRDSQLTKDIVKIPDELEACLGIPKAGADHRKPQHVMFCYETGKIEREQMQSLREILQPCLDAFGA